MTNVTLNQQDDEEICSKCGQELHTRTCSRYNEIDEYGEDY